MRFFKQTHDIKTPTPNFICIYDSCLVRVDAFVDLFPSLFAIAESKDACVKDYWNEPTYGEGWNPLFTRLFNDWEVEEVQRLLFQLGLEAVIKGREDRFSWIESKDGLFSVKLLY